MANTLATPHWEDIRRLAEQGVPFPKLAEEYNVAVKSIYNRSGMEDWLTPSKVKAKINSHAQNRRENRETPLLGGAERAEKSDSLLLETWETRAADLRNLAYGVAVQAIKESKGQIVIETASDLKHAVHVARQATGILDTDQPQIQLSLFGNGDICGPSIMENDSHPVVELQDAQEVDDFWG
jgi:hypothetical protein